MMTGKAWRAVALYLLLSDLLNAKSIGDVVYEQTRKKYVLAFSEGVSYFTGDN